MRYGTAIGAVGLALLGSAIPTASLAAPPAKVFRSGDCGSTVYSNVMLTSNVDCSGTNATSLTVGANNVSINLNGYTFTGAVFNVAIDSNAHSGVSVYGGTIWVPGSGAGVFANHSPSIFISKVNFSASASTSSGIRAENSARVQVSYSTFTGWVYGFSSMYSNVTLSRSTFTSNGTGYYSDSDSLVTVSGCTFTGNDFGLYEDSTASIAVVNTVADNNTMTGMEFNSGEYGVINVSSSYSRGNGVYGIHGYYTYRTGSSATSSITNTVASGNQDTGIYVDHPGTMTLKGNVTYRNYYYGILVAHNNETGATSASFNTSRNNGWYGFYGQYSVPGSANTGHDNGVSDCHNFVCSLARR